MFSTNGKYATGRRVLTLLVILLTTVTTIHAQSAYVVLPGYDVSIGQVIDAVHAQTNYKIAYTASVVDTDKNINFQTLTISVKEALEEIVKEENADYVVQKNYIALVPKTETPKPAATLHNPRTVQRVVEPAVPIEPEPVQAPKPEIQYYSNYTPIDIYADFPTALPRWSIKANLLYAGVALTPNLGIEIGLTPKSTLEISGSYNAFGRDKKTVDDTKQLLHRAARVEYRWWFCERFSRHFLGAHAFFAQYNISGYNIPLLFDNNYRYEGNAYGVGITYGYQLPLSKSGGLEFSVGLGAAYLNYNKFTCALCDRDPIPAKKFYFGPTRAGISIAFIFK